MIVAFGLTVVNTAVTSLLAIDDDDFWYRNAVKRRARRLRPEGDLDVPGVYFLEIDGLAYDVLRRAIRDGNAPNLARWLRDGDHRLLQETDWSSQTGACQAGLLHGDNDDMPAFRWWEKDRGRAIVTNHPRDAAEIEHRHSNGRGLLHEDGASRANIVSGDAVHTLLTMSTVLDRKRSGRIGEDYFAYFANPYNVTRTIALVIADIVQERRFAAQQRRRDVRPRIHRDRKYALVRAWGTVVQTDLQVEAVIADLYAAGRSATRRFSPTTRSPIIRASSEPTRWRCFAAWTARSAASSRPGKMRSGPTGSWSSPTTASRRARPSSTATASRSTSWCGRPARATPWRPRTRTPTRR